MTQSRRRRNRLRSAKNSVRKNWLNRSISARKKRMKLLLSPSAQSSAQTLDQRVESLRHQAERVVKAPGGSLKSAPFQSATNVKSLEAGEEVVIVIVTPYWYGVETTEGQHGWMNRRQLEPLAMRRRISCGMRTLWPLCLLLCAIPMMVSAQADSAAGIPYERSFPQSKAVMEKRIKELQSCAGRLPVLDGFTVPGDRPLNRFQTWILSMRDPGDVDAIGRVDGASQRNYYRLV